MSLVTAKSIVMPPKYDPHTRPLKGIGGYMIGVVTAQELRANLGDIKVAGRTCTEWIDYCIRQLVERPVSPSAHPVVLLEATGTTL